MKVLVFDKLPATGFMEDIAPYLDWGFTFSTNTPGLFNKFSGTIGKNTTELFSKFQSYLGNRIVIFDNTGQIAWDGLIWNLEITFGNTSLGPRDLGSVYNYVAAEYSDLLDGNKYAITAYVSDADSQAIYGIKEQVAPYGGMTSVAAVNASNRYLANHKTPEMGGTLNIPLSGNNASLRIEALGFWATAQYRKFQSILTTTLTVQNRIKEIVDRSVVPAAPGTSYYLQFISTDTSLIDGTNLTVARATLHYETVGAYLAHLVSLGDTSFNTWYVGIETGSFNGSFPIGLPRLKVWQRPTSPEFFSDISSGKIYGAGGGVVNPFQIRAGNFVQIRDLVPQATMITSPLDKLRGFIISETSYDSRTGIINARPEGNDLDVSIVLARMAG